MEVGGEGERERKQDEKEPQVGKAGVRRKSRCRLLARLTCIIIPPYEYLNVWLATPIDIPIGGCGRGSLPRLQLHLLAIERDAEVALEAACELLLVYCWIISPLIFATRESKASASDHGAITAIIICRHGNTERIPGGEGCLCVCEWALALALFLTEREVGGVPATGKKKRGSGTSAML